MSAAPADRVHPVLLVLTALVLAGGVVVAARLPLARKSVFVGRTSLLLASRNEHAAGTMTMEDDKGVILSTTSLARGEPVERAVGNRLSIWVFARVHDAAGRYRMADAHLFGSLVGGLAVAIFFVAFYRRLGYRIALLGGLAWISCPTFLAYLAPGHAELSTLALAVALLAALGPGRPGWRAWLVAGVATGLATAAKLSFAFFAPALLVWAVATRSGPKSILAFLLPLPLAGVLYLGPDRILEGRWAEDYGIVSGDFDQEEHPPFRMYGAIYPDPWTFRHDREAFDADHVDRFDKYWGFTTVRVPWTDRLRIHARTLASYVEKTAEVRVFGGPLVVFGMLLGLVVLWRRDRPLVAFGLLTLVVTVILNVVSLDARGEHRISEMLFLFALPLGVALEACLRALVRAAGGRARGTLLGLVFLGAFLAHQAAATRVAFGRIYSGAGQTDRLIERIDEVRAAGVEPGEVVAVGGETPVVFQLALYTDRDLVAFKESTVRRLLDEGRLAEAFAEYDVRWIAGYSPETTARVVAATGVRAVAANLEGSE